MLSAFSEVDRVTGGGFVPGSVVLIGGDPGIGKSTLLLQICASLTRTKKSVVYISGEEALPQIRLRAGRLKLLDEPIALATETHVETIIHSLQESPPDFFVIDSIQTMWTDTLEQAPGTVSQLRGSTQALVSFAKTYNVTLILVGHVTKEGQLAGPRVLEHMVDVVLSFEGDSARHFRVLRTVKNRFGPTEEIGVFEMTSIGLSEVSNPSALFLAGRDLSAPGTAVFAGIEGSRTLLFEIQALVAPSGLAMPRRAVVGWDSNRLAMILAVLEKHGRMKWGAYDIYLNVAGGLKISEPAADLAVIAALLSSLSSVPVPSRTIYCGEVGLSGTVRPVGQISARLREGYKLGFSSAVLPSSSGKDCDGEEFSLSLEYVGHVRDLLAGVGGGHRRGYKVKKSDSQDTVVSLDI
jgi:DNA repair protein RadA/Sms